VLAVFPSQEGGNVNETFGIFGLSVYTEFFSWVFTDVELELLNFDENGD